jgi:hypothetical protein
VEKESVKKKPDPPETPISPGDGQSTPGGEGKRERPSSLDMLFREAEVIAQNLKESGTRR